MERPAEVFTLLDPPLWVLTAQAAERHGGMIATFVTNASIVPDMARVIVGVARQHHTWGLIEASGGFALHLLGEGNRAWVAHFGLRSGRDVNKLEGWSTRAASTGSPLLDGVAGWLDCRVEARMQTGDRTVYLGEVLAGGATGDAPLTLKRYLQQASAEERAELGRLTTRDQAIDAAAIRAWRGGGR